MGCNNAISQYFKWLSGEKHNIYLSKQNRQQVIYVSSQIKWQWIRNVFISVEIGTPPAPALLADSLTATSLSLEWQIPPRLAEFTKGRSHITRNYLVQWRYEESGNDWKYCRNQSMGDNSTIHVENLQPYTKYRVSLVFKQ